jgi:hypothetical protein
MKSLWRVVAGSALIAGLIHADVSFASPVYIGLQEAGINGGAITNEGNADGTFSLVNLPYGTFSVNAGGTGAPILTEPQFFSNTLTTSSSTPGVLNIYLSALNQNVLPAAFSSTLTSNNLPAGWTLTESTFVTACGASPCTVADAFATGNLLSTTTFNSTGTVTMLASNPLGSGPYVTTERFTISSNGSTGSGVNANIDLSATPIPGTLPLFAGALALIGVLGWRRRAAASAAMAAA